ncbi:MAG: RNA-binding protein [Gammaproteobacteria bacterium]|jgi:ribosome-associated heat shock protein Hsp15|nr:RNA-binding protein [Gammaproteobacteria bacterium]MBT5464483.1 RNA-binding protein [Gammaproteobacteria bacterium]MBT7388537.1 RNA-binding protein [Gammaproteobacteria bacterium]
MIRTDKWLWAARFYKTRAQAKEAVDGGKVKVNGARTKPAKEIKINDLVEFKAGWDDRAVLVTALSDIRRGAAEAARLFEETAASLQNRENARLKRASLGPMPKGERPTKRDRRQIHRLVSRPDS